ncbi:MAG: energy-coupling factor transporter transmembrane protein EcfT [Anaerolineales bacterium]|nr:energy-coupling factor transporter transmembrane protein EcfT [Anaerolineales bacterium]
MFHTWAWIAWLAISAAALSSTRNPLYLILILMSALLLHAILVERSHGAATFVSPLRFSLFITAAAVFFNGLTSHFGETIFFVIPGKIPLISGPVTLEALAFGFSNGLVLSGLLVSFSILNLGLPLRSLVHLIPRAFYPLAIVTSIAITFVPVTRRQLGQVREAQAIRGHRLRGVRDWAPLVMPLLVGGLERALQLAETMTARGFASGEDGASALGYRLAMLLGTTAVLLGWLASLSAGWRNMGMALMLLGVVAVVGSLWWVGKQASRTTYRKEPWRRQDWLVVLGALATLAFFALDIPGVQRQTLAYNPYPLATLPGFDPFIGLATLGLLAPGVMMLIEKP